MACHILACHGCHEYSMPCRVRIFGGKWILNKCQKDCRQCFADNILPITFCRLHFADNMLPTTFCRQHFAAQTLPTTFCRQHFADNILPITFWSRFLACHVPNVACHGVSISIVSISSVSCRVSVSMPCRGHPVYLELLVDVINFNLRLQ